MNIGILLPFIGTTLGSSIVFFMKNLNKKIEKILLSFASGVMIAASFWSLITPSLELSKNYKLTWLPTTIGLILGIIFFIIADKILEKTNKSNKTFKMALAVTLHNIPEGMAVGVIYASLLNNQTTINIAFALALGIAIQNIPEGAIISLPYKNKGKIKAFFIGVLSGIVEPIASIITIIITNFISQILPYTLSFAASAMIYVVITELIPETQDKKKYPIISFMIGFIIMMILDVAL